ncbi:hypothetical protein ACFQ05_04455 [Amycolatopsis umgeniensis]|uniref:Uncharacterized protein n=1 Tax=Amycolatopsis umgeniensis TaxID=336628 RepID=A0A841B2D4_9PSEU|nr:hypothetical protein [Amycolatopsis umgeniensis]MBB5852518.1 hypothetical protein [Amycolatopsis umgeniensis]
MGRRLFVPAVFADLFASMPPKTASVSRCREWLEATETALRSQISGPHGVQAMRMIPLLMTVRYTSF